MRNNYRYKQNKVNALCVELWQRKSRILKWEKNSISYGDIQSTCRENKAWLSKYVYTGLPVIQYKKLWLCTQSKAKTSLVDLHFMETTSTNAQYANKGALFWKSSNTSYYALFVETCPHFMVLCRLLPTFTWVMKEKSMTENYFLS